MYSAVLPLNLELFNAAEDTKPQASLAKTFSIILLFLVSTYPSPTGRFMCFELCFLSCLYEIREKLFDVCTDNHKTSHYVTNAARTEYDLGQ